jgi:hypothetical protein
MKDAATIAHEVHLLDAEVERIVASKSLAREDKVLALNRLWGASTREGRIAFREIMFLKLAGLCLPKASP